MFGGSLDLSWTWDTFPPYVGFSAHVNNKAEEEHSEPSFDGPPHGDRRDRNFDSREPYGRGPPPRDNYGPPPMDRYGGPPRGSGYGYGKPSILDLRSLR